MKNIGSHFYTSYVATFVLCIGLGFPVFSVGNESDQLPNPGLEIEIESSVLNEDSTENVLVSDHLKDELSISALQQEQKTFFLDSKGYYSVTDPDKNYMPNAPIREMSIIALSKYSKEEQQAFHVRRLRILGHVKSIFLKLRSKPILMTRALIALNQKIYDSMGVVISGRTAVANLSFNLGLGIGVSSGIRDRLLRIKIFGRRPFFWVPQRGFYYAFGLGFAVTSTENAKHFMVYADVDRLEHVFSFTGEVSAAVNWGFGFESLETQTQPVLQDLKSDYVGILGAIRSGENHFSYNLITGAAFPMYLPVFMIYTNNTKRARLLSIPLEPIKKLLCKKIL